uniref:Lysophosphatidylcholine acyltransferase 4 n=1 Tax=Sphenodon punctatus TaxID=8508 RepID=A0A8D0HF28_SPHPU
TPPRNFLHMCNMIIEERFYVLGALLAPIRVALAFVVLFLIWPFALLQVVGLSRPEVMMVGRPCDLEEIGTPVIEGVWPPLVTQCVCPTCLTPSLFPCPPALLRFNQAILVSRHDPASRKKVVEEVKRRATSRGKWPQVLFFPEGTCSNKKALLKFKPGAFIAGVPIQPVLIRYPNNLVSLEWGVRGMPLLIFLSCSPLLTPSCCSQFLPVYQPSAEETVNPTLYANNVQRAMAQALGIPATECEFLGNLPVTVVGRLRVALEPRIWELGRALHKLRVCARSKHPFSLLSRLGMQDPSGRVDAREVSLALEALKGELGPPELTRHAFELFSESGSDMGDPRLYQDGFCAILHLLLGTPGTDGAQLYRRLCGDCSQKGLSLDQFQDFSLRHPDYACLFSTYLCPPVPSTPLDSTPQAPYANGLSAASLQRKSD